MIEVKLGDLTWRKEQNGRWMLVCGDDLLPTSGVGPSALDEIARLQARVAELEAENAALADDVHDLSPSDTLTEQDCEALMEALTSDAVVEAG